MDNKLNKIFAEYEEWGDVLSERNDSWQKHKSYLSKLFLRDLGTDKKELKSFWKAFDAIHEFNDGDWEEQREYIEYLWKLNERI